MMPSYLGVDVDQLLVILDMSVELQAALLAESQRSLLSIRVKG